MQLTLIAAVAANRVIGKDGEMPWHYPEDLRQFKERTMGKPVIMGRLTYEAVVDRLGGPLPGRTTIVLSSDPGRVESSDPAVRVATSVEAAVDRARETDATEAFVAGGASVYEQFLPLAHRMVLTEIHQSYEGDTEFPVWNECEWEEVQRDSREELSFVTYRRVKAAEER